MAEPQNKKQVKRKLRVLSLDGGGVRGYFSYHLLRRASEKCGDLCCDLVVGVSVGAVVAAAVACPDMLQQEGVFESFANVFSKRNKHGPLREAIYDGKRKRETLHALFGKRRMRDTRCPLVIVCASPYFDLRLFTSWNDPDVLIADALDASSAAPVYFDPVFINKEPLIDGGVVSNSPVDVAVICLGELFGTDDRKSACGLEYEILSIGNRLDERFAQKLAPDARMGLMEWMQFGLIDMLVGVNRAHAEKMVNSIYSGAVTRIVGNVPPRFDDVSPEFRAVMETEAARVFEAQGERICDFFRRS